MIIKQQRNVKKTKTGKGLTLLPVILILFLLVGEVRCLSRMIQCNWNPVGNAEVIYSVGAITGLGGIIGWIPIEDE